MHVNVSAPWTAPVHVSAPWTAPVAAAGWTAPVHVDASAPWTAPEAGDVSRLWTMQVNYPREVVEEQKSASHLWCTVRERNPYHILVL